MSQLFISLYLDEDVDVLVAELINAYGYNALTTRDAGQLEADDASQMAYAAAAGRALLTHNRADFEAIAQDYFAVGREHAGLVLAVRRDPYEIARRLLVILNHVTADEMRNQVRYI